MIKRSQVFIPAGVAGGFYSPGSTFCADLFQYPFHPRVTAVARKRSRSFCQKCRWQVTANHTYTLRIWLCMKWYNMVHDCMVYTERAEMASGTSHVTTKQHCVHQFCGYSLHAIKSYSHSFRIARSEPAWKRRITLHKSDHHVLDIIPCIAMPWCLITDQGLHTCLCVGSDWPPVCCSV